MSSENGPALEVQGLGKRYGTRDAVKDLTFTVPRGALCGFLGPNGSGKTTTIRMLLGLVTPTSGNARVLGHAITDRAALCRRVGAIVETPAFYPYLSGAENLKVLAHTSGVALPTTRLESLLARVSLTGRGHERVETYSMGMRQRLGIAATLLSDPELLFLDEPMNGLDPAGIQQMRELLASLRDEGKTVFVSSHQLSEVERVCTEVLIIHHGRLRLHGPIDTLGGEGRTYAFRVHPLERAQAILADAHPAIETRAERPLLIVRCTEDQLPTLSRTLVEGGVELFGLEPRTSQLEARFLTLTAEAA